MKVELIAEPMQYTVRIGDKAAGSFKVESEWEGFMKLKDARGRILIVMQTGSYLQGMMSEIFGNPKGTAFIAASPELMQQLGIAGETP